MHPLALAIPRFIQIIMPLPPLKPMAQSRRGVTQIMEAQMHPLTVAIPRSVGAFEPPSYESPHAVIEPSALRAAKAYLVE
jgi:hypothetical protein